MSVEHTKKVVSKEETQQEFVSVRLWELLVPPANLILAGGTHYAKRIHEKLKNPQQHYKKPKDHCIPPPYLISFTVK